MALIGSKNVSDVVEAVSFLIAARQFELEGCDELLRKMLLLVWSKDVTITDAVVDAFAQVGSPDCLMGLVSHAW